MDYEILIEGTSYHDPDIPEDQITWQYTTVKPDFVFPANIRYEIIEECYILEETDEDEDEIETKSSGFNLEKKLLSWQALKKK